MGGGEQQGDMPPMQYRNIDDDPRLLKTARRLGQGEINESQARWILGSEGYSEREITEAFHDYRLIYERPEKIIKTTLPVALLLLLLLLILISL